MKKLAGYGGRKRDLRYQKQGVLAKRECRVNAAQINFRLPRSRNTLQQERFEFIPCQCRVDRAKCCLLLRVQDRRWPLEPGGGMQGLGFEFDEPPPREGACRFTGLVDAFIKFREI